MSVQPGSRKHYIKYFNCFKDQSTENKITLRFLFLSVVKEYIKAPAGPGGPGAHTSVWTDAGLRLCRVRTQCCCWASAPDVWVLLLDPLVWSWFWWNLDVLWLKSVLVVKVPTVLKLLWFLKLCKRGVEPRNARTWVCWARTGLQTCLCGSQNLPVLIHLHTLLLFCLWTLHSFVLLQFVWVYLKVGEVLRLFTKFMDFI